MPTPSMLRRTLPYALATLALASADAAAQRPLPADRPVPAPRPPAPAAVRAEAVGPGTVRITWSAVEGATAYDVARLVAPNGWQRVARVGAVTEHTESGRDLAKPHVYGVVAVVGTVASARALSDTVGGAALGRVAATPDGDGMNGGGGGGASGSGGGASGDAKKRDPLAPVGCSRLDAEFTRCTGSPVAWNPRRDEIVVAEVSCPGGAIAVGGGHIGEFPYGILTESAPTNGGWRISVAPMGRHQGQGPATGAVVSGLLGSGGTSDGAKQGDGVIVGLLDRLQAGYVGIVQAHVVCRRSSGE